MKHYSLYDLKTGLFSRALYSFSNPEEVALNTPDGFAALEGHFDSLCQSVDIATGDVIDYQPPSPSADHEWDEATKRWQLSAAAQATIDKRAAALSRIAQLEASQHRASRELSLGRPGALERLQAIDADIAKLRLDL